MTGAIELLLYLITGFTLIGVASFVALYLVYIVVMKLKPYKDVMPKIILYPAKWLFFAGFLGDVLWNIIFGSVLFWQKPDFKGANTDFKGIPLPTLTERLRDIIKGNTNIKMLSARWKIAYFICERLLEPFDQGHCK